MGSSAIMPSKQQALNEANSAKSGEKTAVKQELAEPGAGMVPSPRAPDRDTRGPTRPYTSNPQTTTPGPPSQPGEGQDLQSCPRQGIPYTVQNGAPSEWPTAGVPPPTPQRLQHGPLPYLPQRQHPAGTTQQPTRESPQAAGPMWQHHNPNLTFLVTSTVWLGKASRSARGSSVLRVLSTLLPASSLQPLSGPGTQQVLTKWTCPGKRQ